MRPLTCSEGQRALVHVRQLEARRAPQGDRDDPAARRVDPIRVNERSDVGGGLISTGPESNATHLW